MVNILARIVDSERNFNGSADPMITADRGFIQILGPDFGFCLFGSSDRGSQRRLGKLTRELKIRRRRASTTVDLVEGGWGEVAVAMAGKHP